MSFSTPVGWYGGGHSVPGAAAPRGSRSHVVVLASLLYSSKYWCSAECAYSAIGTHDSFTLNEMCAAKATVLLAIWNCFLQTSCCCRHSSTEFNCSYTVPFKACEVCAHRCTHKVCVWGWFLHSGVKACFSSWRREVVSNIYATSSPAVYLVHPRWLSNTTEKQPQTGSQAPTSWRLVVDDGTWSHMSSKRKWYELCKKQNKNKARGRLDRDGSERQIVRKLTKPVFVEKYSKRTEVINNNSLHFDHMWIHTEA